MEHPLHVTVLITTQPGKAHEQISAFEQLAPVVGAEPGCLRYELTQSLKDENEFVLLETWASLGALQAHDASAHMQAADAKNSQFRAGPAAVFITRNI